LQAGLARLVVIDPTIDENDLGDRSTIGKGGMAVVYDTPSLILPEDPGERWVYKKYKQKHRPVALYAMQQLVRHRAAQDPRVRAALDRSFSWPRRVVIDGGEGAAGVVLPRIPDRFFVTLTTSSGKRTTKPTEGQFLFQDSSYCTRVGIPYATEGQRRAIARSLSHAFATLDHVAVVYGDLSALNFLWTLTPRPAVLLVDCDSVRVTSGAAPFGRQPHSPDWEPPEALEARRLKQSTAYTIQNLATDRYKLGLAILRVLTPGSGCASRLDPAAARSALPGPLHSLLVRSLGDDTGQRPSAREWYEAMTR
jgi:DNA-binding helix-hairpin-helix protein with protein kinase domain